MTEQRTKITLLFKQNPSLKNNVQNAILEIYPNALDIAVIKGLTIPLVTQTAKLLRPKSIDMTFSFIRRVYKRSIIHRFLAHSRLLVHDNCAFTPPTS